jgi:hypothetical protein
VRAMKASEPVRRERQHPSRAVRRGGRIAGPGGRRGAGRPAAPAAPAAAGPSPPGGAFIRSGTR